MAFCCVACEVIAFSFESVYLRSFCLVTTDIFLLYHDYNPAGSIHYPFSYCRAPQWKCDWCKPFFYWWHCNLVECWLDFSMLSWFLFRPFLLGFTACFKTEFSSICFGPVSSVWVGNQAGCQCYTGNPVTFISIQFFWMFWNNFNMQHIAFKFTKLVAMGFISWNLFIQKFNEFMYFVYMNVLFLFSCGAIIWISCNWIMYIRLKCVNECQRYCSSPTGAVLDSCDISIRNFSNIFVYIAQKWSCWEIKI